jgi:hypothetical protein
LENSREFLEKHWFEDKSSTTYFLIGYADFLADFPRRLTLAVNLVKIGLSVRSGLMKTGGCYECSQGFFDAWRLCEVEKNQSFD